MSRTDSFSRRLVMAASLALMAFLAQSCYIDATRCTTHYRTVPVSVCTTDCDIWGYCFENCWYESQTESYEVCDYDDEYYSHRNGACRTNANCGPDSVCVSGECRYKTVSRGTVEMCGGCSSTSDCREDGAACTVLAVSNEQVCTRGCTYDADCPTGFKCSRVGEGDVMQCLPTNNSCDPNFCVTSFDCSNNADCLNNQCMADNTGVNECDSYLDCRNEEFPLCYLGERYSYCTQSCYIDTQCLQGYACRLMDGDMDSGVCLESQSAGCVYSADCGDGLVCLDGRCAKPCTGERDCEASAGDYFTCSGGFCVFSAY